MQIVGKKGGGKGGSGGGTVYTPSEAPNTLRSKSVASVIDFLSVGPIKGLVDGDKSIYYDGTPLQNSDGSYNFQGVSYQTRYGVPDQLPFEGDAETASESEVNLKVTKVAPATASITNPDATSFRVKVQVPALMEQKTNGDLVGSEVSFKIEVKTASGSYEPINLVNFTGWRFKIEIHPFTPTEPGQSYATLSVEYTATASEASADALGAKLAQVLNDNVSPILNIGGAAYDSGTNTLTVAGAGDGVGDKTLDVYVYPPGEGSPVNGLATTVVHEGSSGDALSFRLPDDGVFYIKGKTVSPYPEEYYGRLTPGGDPWTIRVTRITDDNESAAKQNDLYFMSVTEIIDANLMYWGAAVIRQEVDSQVFGGRVPRRSFDIYGLEIEIPSNYYPLGTPTTNLINKSEEINDNSSAWGHSDIAVFANQTTNPVNGEATAEKMTPSATTAQHYVSHSFSATDGETYTGSIYLKAATSSKARVSLAGSAFTDVYVEVNLSTGAVIASGAGATGHGVEDMGDGWYRVHVTGARAGGFSPVFQVNVLSEAGSLSWLGDGRYLYAFGGQVVHHDEPATYIPTGETTVEGLDLDRPRGYVGVWDGTFKTEWTDNPAWVLYAVLTNKVWGQGHKLSADNVDKWTLYQIGQRCDELVPDGYGGLEPRFTFNGGLYTGEQSYSVINAISSVFLGASFWSAGVVGFSQDAPGDVAAVVGQANIIGDFEYEGSALGARHNAILVSWNNPEIGYAPDIELVENPTSINKNGYNDMDTAALFSTSRGQANRFGRWIAFTEENETDIVGFRVGYDLADILPGKLIAIADPAHVGVRLSGRAFSVAGVEVQLDMAYEVQGGDKIYLTLSDGTVELISLVGNVSGSVVELAAEPSGTVNPMAVYVLVSGDIQHQKFRVLTRTEESKNIFHIIALKHYDEKFDVIENGVAFDLPKTSLLPTGGLLPPSSLNVVEALVKINNATLTRVVVSWAPSPDPRVALYRLEAAEPGGNFGDLTVRPQTTFEFLTGVAGEWTFAVTALFNSTEAGASSSRITKTVTIVGKNSPPDDVSGLTALRRADGVRLVWNKVDDLDLIGYQIRQGASWDTADVLDELTISTSIFVPLSTMSEVTFLVKAVDEIGLESDNVASVTSSILSISSVDVDDLLIYQVGSRLRMEWSPIVIEAASINYEIRVGSSWAAGRPLGVVSGHQFSTEYSVEVTTTLNIMIRPYVELVSGVKNYGAVTEKEFVKHPSLNGNIIFTQREETTWAGSKTDVSVVGDNLVLNDTVLSGTYVFNIDLTSEEFGRAWFEFEATSETGTPLYIYDATGYIHDATYHITPAGLEGSDLQVVVEIQPDETGPWLPFREADYQFTTANVRITLSRPGLDDVRPSLTSFAVFFDVPDRML